MYLYLRMLPGGFRAPGASVFVFSENKPTSGCQWLQDRCAQPGEALELMKGETAMAHVTEGYMPFLGYQTYYRITGEENPDKAPLLLLHGGPGSTHNYFEVFDQLAESDERQVIMYDQLGCGNSFVEGHPELWNQETWLDELEQLRDHLGLDQVHILGQSWGGMMQVAYACDRHPEGVRSYIISSGNPSSHMWEAEGLRRIALMDERQRKAIYHAMETGDFEDSDYLAAVDEYMRRYCDPEPKLDLPECVTRDKRFGDEAYLYGWGPNEFCPTGTLKDFEYVNRLGEIDIPCLICSGIQDLCSPLIAKTMHDGIKGSQWNLYPHSHHMCFIDDENTYMKDAIRWLNQHD